MQARQLEYEAEVGLQGVREGDFGELGARRERFVPLGFEASSGAFGRATVDFLREVEAVAAGQSSSDLYHWSGAEWRTHWRQRLSLRLAKGHAALVLGAVATARNNADSGSSAVKASLEWTETGCRPCVV